MAGQRGVVGLDVQFEILLQAEFEKEGVAIAGVEVVLMLGRLLGLGLDHQLAVEPDLFLVVHGHAHETPHVLQFAFHVGVEQRVIAFASSPENITLSAQFHRDFHRLLHLAGGVGEDGWIRIGRGAGHEAAVRKGVGCAPEKLHSGIVLQLFGEFDDSIEAPIGLGQVVGLGRDVAVVEAPEGNSQLGKKLEGRAHCVFGLFHRIGVLQPGADRRAGAERIGAGGTESVPHADGEAQVLGHGFAHDDFRGIVVFIGKRIPGVRALIGDLGHVGEKALHHILLLSLGICATIGATGRTRRFRVSGRL
ncbi:MAG: hypothetical protein BWZ10_02512 [candidate division BRC1 bacterium ADurb.BinA364]|nr:MAG: hypothetical protein BWZ10_02512 [candidate division BRC1 bacterium ADurb.BinA364]